MTLMDVLDKNLIQVPLKHSTKDEIIAELADLLVAHRPALDRDGILKAVIDRERMGSTGLADGIAIPHAKTAAIDRVSVAIGISKVPVDFRAQDGKPSQFFFLVLAPEKESAAYIEILASIARATASPVFRRLLSSARSADEVVRLFLD
ncbi:MAG: PTS sugar transporter subunit IIA [Sphaerochaetaceae bacterium]|nr:PTS sugar transporter subunit IIA [Sphaerochaetaceae bacterium]